MRLFFTSLLILVWGCSHDASVQIAPAINVYSGYSNLIPGKYGVIVNDKIFEGKADKSTWECSAHKYPLDARVAFRESAIRTAENLFEDTEVLSEPIRGEKITARGLVGVAIFEGTLFRPEIDFDQNFWSSDAEASVDVGVSVEIHDESGRIFASRVGATGRGEKDAGALCSGGAKALGKAAEFAIQDALERSAERLANSPELRKNQ